MVGRVSGERCSATPLVFVYGSAHDAAADSGPTRCAGLRNLAQLLGRRRRCAGAVHRQDLVQSLARLQESRRRVRDDGRLFQRRGAVGRQEVRLSRRAADRTGLYGSAPLAGKCAWEKHCLFPRFSRWSCGVFFLLVRVGWWCFFFLPDLRKEKSLGSEKRRGGK